MKLLAICDFPVCENKLSNVSVPYEDYGRGGNTGKSTDANSSDGDFFMSAVVGYATNSTVAGWLIGGDFAGGLTGDLLNGGL